MLEDVLFKADYYDVSKSTTDHSFTLGDYGSDDKGEKDNDGESYLLFNKTKIIKRRPKNIRAHYGLIVSDN